MRDKIFLISLLIVILCFLACKGKPANSYTNYDLVYGDEFHGFDIYDVDGNLAELPEKSLAGFYVSKGCGSCASAIRNIDRFSKIFKSDDLDYIVLWEDEIPKNLIKKYNIEENKNYSLDGKSKLFGITPSYFILKEGKVDFQTEDMDMFLRKISSGDYESKDRLIKRVNKLIANEYGANDSPKLLYFAMEGCNDCKKANEVLDDKDILDKYDIIKMYRPSDPDDGRLIDKGGFLAGLYDVDWYPTFVKIYEDDFEIIREVPIDQLKDMLLK